MIIFTVPIPLNKPLHKIPFDKSRDRRIMEFDSEQVNSSRTVLQNFPY